MKLIFSVLLIGFLSATAGAAPRCLDLTKKQADSALVKMKIALYQKGRLHFVSKKEDGLVQPHGVWVEKKKSIKGPRSYRVVVDGREVDISLVYLTKKSNEDTGWNLGAMSGCSPAPGKPTKIRFEI